jgi:hypothetical protein
MYKNVIIYAPNVHKGGGLVLLNELINGSTNDSIFAILDSRAKNQIILPSNYEIKWVYPTFISRAIAEIVLWLNSNVNKTVLCFHGLPPVMRTRGRVIVFLQNKNLICKNDIKYFKLWSYLRVKIERLI